MFLAQRIVNQCARVSFSAKSREFRNNQLDLYSRILILSRNGSVNFVSRVLN